MPEPILAVRGLRAGYGTTEILRGVDLVVGHGEIVAVLGSNGAGKSNGWQRRQARRNPNSSFLDLWADPT